MTDNTYDDFSQDYDRFVNWRLRLAAEMPFLQSLLGGIPKTSGEPLAVLDAACGTGMHSIALAQSGYRAAGADLSPRMVYAARENARSAGVDVLFKPAGFIELRAAFEKEPIFLFDALTCFGNSLPHLTSREDLKMALVDFAACLRPGGMLVLQNRNFDAVLARRERWISPQDQREGNKEWLFLRFYDFDPDGLITFNIVRLKREGEAPWSQAVSTVRLYPLVQAELETLLSACGFERARFYGMLQDIPFDPESSENLVTVAFKA